MKEATISYKLEDGYSGRAIIFLDKDRVSQLKEIIVTGTFMFCTLTLTFSPALEIVEIHTSAHGINKGDVAKFKEKAAMVRSAVQEHLGK